MSELSLHRARKLFSYNPDTGQVHRLIGVHGGKRGQRAGSLSTMKCRYKYWRITVDYQGYILARVIWFMQTGKWPDEIDHINGDPTDNRWCNLRDVPHTENQKNLRVSKNNNGGIIGVYWNKDRKKWHSRITVKDKTVILYYGNDFLEACCLRKSAEIKYGFHENHGRR